MKIFGSVAAAGFVAIATNACNSADGESAGSTEGAATLMVRCNDGKEVETTPTDSEKDLREACKNDYLQFANECTEEDQASLKAYKDIGVGATVTLSAAVTTKRTGRAMNQAASSDDLRLEGNGPLRSCYIVPIMPKTGLILESPQAFRAEKGTATVRKAGATCANKEYALKLEAAAGNKSWSVYCGTQEMKGDAEATVSLAPFKAKK